MPACKHFIAHGGLEQEANIVARLARPQKRTHDGQAAYLGRIPRSHQTARSIAFAH